MLRECPFCHHSDSSLHREKQELKGGGSRDIYKCNECSLLYPEVRLDTSEVAEYISKLHTNKADSSLLDPKRKYDSNLLLAEFAKETMTMGKSLDIGTYDGRLTYVFGDLGFESYGLESQDRGVAFAQSHGLKVYKGAFPNEVPEVLAKQKYALITMSEMIYYLTDLKEALSKVYSMLQNNGFFMIKAHQGNSKYYNNHSYFSRYRDNVQGIPTLESLNYCLNKSGFSTLKFQGFTDYELCEEYNYIDVEIETADVLYVVCQKEVAFQYDIL